MSATSLDLSFSTSAEELNQEKYQRSITTVGGYDHNHPEMEKNVHGLMESRIQPISDGKGQFAESVVDGCIKVKGVAANFTQYQAEEWKKKEAENLAGRNKAGIIAGVVALCASLLPAFDKKNGTAASLIIAISIIVGGIFAYISHSRASHAAKEADAWKNYSPALEAAKERTEAYKTGFLYAYSNQLKIEKEGAPHSILHSLEVQGMYEKYFPEFYGKLRAGMPANDKEQEIWINGFLSSNPIAPALLKYGLAEIPPHLQAASEDFYRFYLMWQNHRGSIRDRQYQIRLEAAKKIAEHEEHKQKILKPLLDKKEAAIAKARETYEEACKKYPDLLSENRKFALETFNTTKKAFEEEYTKGTASIFKLFDEKVAAENQSRDALLLNLSILQTTQVPTFYALARELSLRAEKAWTEKAYTSVNFQAYFNWQTAATSAP